MTVYDLIQKMSLDFTEAKAKKDAKPAGFCFHLCNGLFMWEAQLNYGFTLRQIQVMAGDFKPNFKSE
jgi:hypothetical protein